MWDRAYGNKLYVLFFCLFWKKWLKNYWHFVNGKTAKSILIKNGNVFLCTAEHYSIINPVLLHKFKGYNKENGKPDESLGCKARRG